MALCPFAQNLTAGMPNVGGAMGTIRLGVVHVMAGTLAGTESWFDNPAAQVSAHFGIGKDGTIVQWVDTSRVAWAEMNYNGEAISIEHEGQSGDQLTQAQIDSLAKLMAWCAFVHGLPIQRTSDPNGTGWIGHGELGAAGGNHPDCPGQPILDQLFWIVLSASHPTPSPAPPTPEPSPVPTPPAPPATTGTITVPIVHPGDKSVFVKRVQTLLNCHGFGLAVTGVADAPTMAAVVTMKQRWQFSNSLPIIGAAFTQRLLAA